MEKNKKIFPCGALLLYIVHEVFIEVPLFQETCSAQNNSWLHACNIQLTFNPNLHPSIYVFANLPIYRKLIHDNILALCFEYQESFVQYYFKGDIKYYLYIQIYALEPLVSVILNKIKIIFTPIYLRSYENSQGRQFEQFQCQ